MRKLNVLMTSNSFYPPRGGGDISLRILASKLSAMGHSITVAYTGEEDPEFRCAVINPSSPLRGFWPRQMTTRKFFRTELGRVVKEASVDVAITQQTALTPTVDACSELGVPVIAMLRGVDFLCLGSFWTGKEWRCDYRCIGCEDAGSRILQFPFFRMEIGGIRNSLRRVDAIVSNSEYTRRTLSTILGLESSVLNPPIEQSHPRHHTRYVLGGGETKVVCVNVTDSPIFYLDLVPNVLFFLQVVREVRTVGDAPPSR